jgi:peptidoglycan/LPS O-acetylase OafA/YrhL
MIVAMGAFSAIASFFAMLYPPGQPSGYLLRVVDFVRYAPCFWLGLLLARFDFSWRVGLGAISLGALWTLVGIAFSPANAHAGWGLLYFGVVVMALAAPRGWLGRQLSRPLSVWLGERSYSLFLTHFSAFNLANWIASMITPNKGATYFVISRGLGWPFALVTTILVFHFVERPFARGLVTADQMLPPVGRRGNRKDFIDQQRSA